MILGRGMRLVGLGAAFGLAGAFIALRVLERLLFGVERTDAITWIVVLLLLVSVGLAACWFPARKAMRVDPAAALKSA
jgi:ABC-type antimicrobial peptide transport system permease subunit